MILVRVAVSCGCGAGSHEVRTWRDVTRIVMTGHARESAQGSVVQRVSGGATAKGDEEREGDAVGRGGRETGKGDGEGRRGGRDRPDGIEGQVDAMRATGADARTHCRQRWHPSAP